MAAVGHAAKSSRYSVTLLALCIVFFMLTETYSPSLLNAARKHLSPPRSYVLNGINVEVVTAEKDL